jgi:L-fuconolactonase
MMTADMLWAVRPDNPWRHTVITDAQVHIWTRDEGEGALPSPPHRPDGYPLEQLIAEMDEAGVDRALLTPPTLWSRSVNEYALDAVAKYPQRFAIVHQFDHRAPDARGKLASLNAKPYVAIRLLFRQNPEWLEDGTMDWVWADCERLGIPICARTSGTADRLIPIAERHPGLTLIVDHMDNQLGKSSADAFSDRLLSAAVCPNIYVKMTSAPSNSAEPYPYHDLDEPLRQIVEAFGPQRLMWGSDVSNHVHSYRNCVEHFKQLPFLSDEDREWVLGRTVATVLNWPEAG